MSDINVVSKTQKILVDVASSSVSVINAGPQGPPGAVIVPAGGTTGQVLTKASNADYDVVWADPV